MVVFPLLDLPAIAMTGGISNSFRIYSIRIIIIFWKYYKGKVI